MTYSERNRRRSVRHPKSDAGTMSNRHRTVIIVFARYYDVELSHAEQEGRGCHWLAIGILAPDNPVRCFMFFCRQ